MGGFLRGVVFCGDLMGGVVMGWSLIWKYGFFCFGG